jgi:hypothetical protein
MKTEEKKSENTTSVFLGKLLQSPDLEGFIEFYTDEMEIPTFNVYINNLCESTGQVPEQVIKRAAIERTYGHQLFNGRRKPSREKVIQLAFGLHLDVNGTQKLLQIAQKNSLYPKIKRDAAILFCIHNQKDIFETQALLESLGLTLLGGE